jgi:hypothetical protein
MDTSLHDIISAENWSGYKLSALMIDKEQKELRNLLEDGIAALVAMRKGIENSCAELRDIYAGTMSCGAQPLKLKLREKYLKNQT